MLNKENNKNDYPLVELKGIVDELCEKLYYLCSKFENTLFSETYNLICIFFHVLTSQNTSLEIEGELTDYFSYAFPYYLKDDANIKYNFYPDTEVAEKNIGSYKLESKSIKHITSYLKVINSMGEQEDITLVLSSILKDIKKDLTSLDESDDSINLALEHDEDDDNKQNFDLIIKNIVIMYCLKNCIKYFTYDYALMNLYMYTYLYWHGTEEAKRVVYCLFKLVKPKDINNEDELFKTLETNYAKLCIIITECRKYRKDSIYSDEKTINSFLLDRINILSKDKDGLVINFLQFMRITYNDLIYSSQIHSEINNNDIKFDEVLDNSNFSLTVNEFFDKLISKFLQDFNIENMF